MSKPSITTNIGFRVTPEKIELAVTSKKDLKKFASVPFEPQTIQHGEIKNHEKFQAALDQLLSQNPLPSKFATLGIPEHSSFIRSYPVSNLPESEITSKILWELESQLPLAADELYLDWAWLNKEQNLVQVSAAPKAVIDSYIAALKEKHQINTLAVETTSISLLRIVPEIKQPALVIDADSTTTLVIIETNHSANLSAVSQSAGQHLNHQLPQTVTDMLSYYQKTYQQTVGQIFYTGALQTEAASVMPKDLPSQPLPLTQKIDPSQAICYSLAQMPVAPPESPFTINLIPPDIQSNYNQASVHKLKKSFMMISAVFLLIINIISIGFIFQILRQQSAVPPAQENPITESDFLNKITEINQQSIGTIQIVQQKKTFSQTFNQLLSGIPSELAINYIKMETTGNRVTIRGFAKNQDEVLKFKKQLEETENFTNVTLPLSVLEKQTNLDFTINFTWENNLKP